MTRAERYFRNYLRIGPLGLALWRSVEARHLGKIKLPHPILDIGCGFGEFAVAYAASPIDMGIDTNPNDLRACAKTGKYKNLTLGDAREMPFADNSFGSIFSISTLEHIPHAEKVLSESYRILKPGGVLFLTLETNEVDKVKCYAPFLRKIGFSGLAKQYEKIFSRTFHRHSLLSKSEWITLTKNAGFKIEKQQDIISKKVTFLFDFFLPISFPSQMVKKITGKRVAVRPRFVDDLIIRFFLPMVTEEEKDGTNLLILARKPLKKRKS